MKMERLIGILSICSSGRGSPARTTPGQLSPWAAKNATHSLMILAGARTLTINPVNRKTHGTPAGKAGKEEKPGACFIDYGGNIVAEISQLTGAYIDSQRNALKVTDVTPKEYSPRLFIFSDGVYHLYDYQFSTAICRKMQKCGRIPARRIRSLDRTVLFPSRMKRQITFPAYIPSGESPHCVFSDRY